MGLVFVILIFLDLIFNCQKIIRQRKRVQYINLLFGKDEFEYEQYFGNIHAAGDYSNYWSVNRVPRTPNKGLSMDPIKNFSGYVFSRGSGYRHSDSPIIGFGHQCHQYNRNGNISFMPMICDLKTSPGILEEPETV